MALDEPKDGDVHQQVDGLPFAVAAGLEEWIGHQRDVRVERLASGELYAATTLSAECCAWFDAG